MYPRPPTQGEDGSPQGSDPRRQRSGRLDRAKRARGTTALKPAARSFDAHARRERRPLDRLLFGIDGASETPDRRAHGCGPQGRGVSAISDGAHPHGDFRAPSGQVGANPLACGLRARRGCTCRARRARSSVHGARRFGSRPLLSARPLCRRESPNHLNRNHVSCSNRVHNPVALGVELNEVAIDLMASASITRASLPLASSRYFAMSSLSVLPVRLYVSWSGRS